MSTRMTMAEFDAALAAHFGPKTSYCITIKRWHHVHADGARTNTLVWSVWTSSHGAFDGSTPEQVLECVRFVPPEPETTETIESTDERLAGFTP